MAPQPDRFDTAPDEDAMGIVAMPFSGPPHDRGLEAASYVPSDQDRTDGGNFGHPRDDDQFERMMRDGPD